MARARSRPHAVCAQQDELEHMLATFAPETTDLDRFATLVVGVFARPSFASPAQGMLAQAAHDREWMRVMRDSFASFPLLEALHTWATERAAALDEFYDFTDDGSATAGLARRSVLLQNQCRRDCHGSMLTSPRPTMGEVCERETNK